MKRLTPLDARPLLAAASAPPAEAMTPRPQAPAETPGKLQRDAARNVVVTRFERRFTWTFFAGLSGTLSLASLAVAAFLAWVAPSAGRLRHRGRILLVLMPSAALAAVLSFHPQRHLSIIYPFLQATIAADRELGMPAVPGVMNVLNALSAASAFALAIACWLLIHPVTDPPRTRTASPRDELGKRLDELQETSTYLRLLLYVATASLVVGVLRMNATLSWMQAFLTAGDAASIDGLRTTTTAMVGAYYSLMLASLYVPAALIVRGRARAAVAGAPVPEAAKAEAYARPELSMALPDVLPRIVVLLGPLLAGPIGEFLKNLAG